MTKRNIRSRRDLVDENERLKRSESWTRFVVGLLTEVRRTRSRRKHSGKKKKKKNLRFRIADPLGRGSVGRSVTFETRKLHLRASTVRLMDGGPDVYACLRAWRRPSFVAAARSRGARFREPKTNRTHPGHGPDDTKSPTVIRIDAPFRHRAHAVHCL